MTKSKSNAPQLARPGVDRFLAPHDVTRQDIGKQIEALSAEIEGNVRRISNAYRRARHGTVREQQSAMNSAIRTIKITARQQHTLENLWFKYTDQLAAEPVPDVPKLYKPATTVTRSRKGYARWSEK